MVCVKHYYLLGYSYEYQIHDLLTVFSHRLQQFQRVRNIDWRYARL